MNVLVIGSGGREHALGWKLKQSSKVKTIYFSPGNAGTPEIGRNIEINNSNHNEVISLVKEKNIDLVVIGPDQYLAEGLVDALEGKNIKVFGPTRSAAEIEWSKSFAKNLMIEDGIPTAKFETFSKLQEAIDYVQVNKFPLVIKADGLSAGKGVSIVQNSTEAKQVLKKIMGDKVYGEAGNQVVIEEYLEGKEISIHAFCDGESIILFPASQDHKRINENDEGPNTGGMGTIAPLPWASEELMTEIKEKIVIPTIRGLKKRGRTFTGVLYPGIMVTSEGPKVIEFNARFGDPETQSYMRLLESDLLEVLLACCDGKLDSVNIKWKDESACCIVIASGGYPGEFKKDIPITIKEEIKKTNDIVVFHAGTKANSKHIVTNGGRVLGVTATGKNLKIALEKAYEAVNLINFEGMQFRKDIGFKSIYTHP